jgi:hypothetical protein
VRHQAIAIVGGDGLQRSAVMRRVRHATSWCDRGRNQSSYFISAIHVRWL